MKNRDNWQKSHYAKFWSNQVARYGFDDYCKGLFKLILAKEPGSVYELAIGTGWPFAVSFHEAGMAVSGSDISDLLVSEIKRKYPGIDAKAEPYDDVSENPEKKYDLVYCLRSTWYFPDLQRALDTMFSLTKEGGWVVFDIMNKDSDHIQEIIKKHRVLFPYTIAKNGVKFLMNKLMGRNHLFQDIWNIHEIPVSVTTIENYLKRREITYKMYSINQITEGLDQPFINGGVNNSKVVFECRNLVS